jgi:nucleoside-diphosphate-sugar epimerase
VKIVIVTGASGFLGRHTVSALRERGFYVHGLSRRPDADVSCEWQTADLFDTDAVQGVLKRVRPTHLLHLAWETEHGRYWTAPANARWVEASLALWRHFTEAGGQRAVGTGTCAEYTWDDSLLAGRPVEEGVPRAPRSFYGLAKSAAFDLLDAYSRSVGLDFAWGRVFFPYGPGDCRPTLIPSVIRALRAGQPAQCTHGRQQRDFVHVRDAATAFAALLEGKVSGAVNIATGTAISIAHVVTTLGALLRRPDLIRLGALEGRLDEPAWLVADIRRLRDEVGFVPRIDLIEGLRETVEWWERQIF